MIYRPTFVVDCSMTMTWCLDDESTVVTNALLDSLKTEAAIVPCLWPIEVANVLLVAERRGRIKMAQTAAAIAKLMALPITIADASVTAMSDIVPLARHHKLSGYDCSYLLLALTTGLPLATLDGDLIRVCGQLGVALL